MKSGIVTGQKSYAACCSKCKAQYSDTTFTTLMYNGGNPKCTCFNIDSSLNPTTFLGKLQGSGAQFGPIFTRCATSGLADDKYDNCFAKRKKRSVITMKGIHRKKRQSNTDTTTDTTTIDHQKIREVHCVPWNVETHNYWKWNIDIPQHCYSKFTHIYWSYIYIDMTSLSSCELYTIRAPRHHHRHS